MINLFLNSFKLINRIFIKKIYFIIIIIIMIIIILLL